VTAHPESIGFGARLLRSHHPGSSPLQLRLLGARGGKAFGRNQRLRRALLPPPTPATVALPAVPRRTNAEAVAALDTCFPWLRGAERRPTRPVNRTPLKSVTQ